MISVSLHRIYMILQGVFVDLCQSTQNIYDSTGYFCWSDSFTNSLVCLLIKELSHSQTG
jgi:hypothetical protein